MKRSRTPSVLVHVDFIFIFFIALQFCCHWHISIRHVDAVLYGIRSRIYTVKILFIYDYGMTNIRYPFIVVSVRK